MTIHADPLFIAAEVERRLELAGIDRCSHHRGDVSHRPLAAHPLAVFVARLVVRRHHDEATRRAARGLDHGRPRHP
jgi:hypothetical protein